MAGRARTTVYQEAVARALVEVAERCRPEVFAALTAELSLSPSTLSDPQLAADWVDLLEGAVADDYRWWVEGALIPDLRPALSELAVPALVVCLGSDRMVAPWASHELARSLPDAVQVDLPGLGHLAIMESPRVVADVIAPFLGRHDDI